MSTTNAASRSQALAPNMYSRDGEEATLWLLRNIHHNHKTTKTTTTTTTAVLMIAAAPSSAKSSHLPPRCAAIHSSSAVAYVEYLFVAAETTTVASVSQLDRCYVGRRHFVEQRLSHNRYVEHNIHRTRTLNPKPQNHTKYKICNYPGFRINTKAGRQHTP